LAHADQNPSAPSYELDYGRIWKAISKVVFSSGLETVDWNSRLVKGSARAEVARLKAQPGSNMRVRGLALASDLAAAGLIDEYRFHFVPILLGSGKAAFLQLNQRVRLQPVKTRTFRSGIALLRCAGTPQ
jgi:dihydrofolate reductase